MENTKIRILFSDDNEDTRLLVATMLGASDYEVITADCVAGALALARKEDFDVYLLDSRLSDGTGTELCERLREFDRDTPVVFSAGAYESDRQRALGCGAQGYVEEPYVSALPKAIARALGAAQQAH